MKKAKLDIWENIPDLDAGKPDGQDFSEPEAGSDLKRGRKWAMNKLLLITAPIVLVVLVIGVLIAFNISRNTSQKPLPVTMAKPQIVHPKSSLPVSPEPSIQYESLASSEKTKILYFKDFMIDLKDVRGNSHVLICDVAFDLGEGLPNDQVENITLMRSIIYKTAQTRSVVALRSVEERKKLKNDLAYALDKILGDGCVKHVYFMNYFIM